MRHRSTPTPPSVSDGRISTLSRPRSWTNHRSSNFGERLSNFGVRPTFTKPAVFGFDAQWCAYSSRSASCSWQWVQRRSQLDTAELLFRGTERSPQRRDTNSRRRDLGTVGVWMSIADCLMTTRSPISDHPVSSMTKWTDSCTWRCRSVAELVGMSWRSISTVFIGRRRSSPMC